MIWCCTGGNLTDQNKFLVLILKDAVYYHKNAGTRKFQVVVVIQKLMYAFPLLHVKVRSTSLKLLWMLTG